MLNDFLTRAADTDAPSSLTLAEHAGEPSTFPNFCDLAVAERAPPGRYANPSIPTTATELACYRGHCTAAYQRRLLAICNRFVGATGCLDFAHVQQPDVARYIDAEVERGGRISTTLSNVNALAALARSAFRRVGLPSDDGRPYRVELRNLRARSRALQTQELPRSVGGVRDLLNGREFAELNRSSAFEDRVTYWAVLLSLFTGMRFSQLSRLSPFDLMWSSDSGYFLCEPARGRIPLQLHPVHDELVRTGLLEFIEQRKSANAQFIFSDVTRQYAKALNAVVRCRISKVWGRMSAASPAPSSLEIQTARRYAVAQVLSGNPQLRSRLESSRQRGHIPSGQMGLVTELEHALRFDGVDWSAHHHNFIATPST